MVVSLVPTVGVCNQDPVLLYTQLRLEMEGLRVESATRPTTVNPITWLSRIFPPVRMDGIEGYVSIYRVQIVLEEQGELDCYVNIGTKSFFWPSQGSVTVSVDSCVPDDLRLEERSLPITIPLN